MVADWNESRGGKAKEEGEESTKEHDSPPDDWILCTLAPSFALSSRAEPLAVVLNYTGERIGGNRRIKLLREECGPIFDGPSDSREERKVPFSSKKEHIAPRKRRGGRSTGIEVGRRKGSG